MFPLRSVFSRLLAVVLVLTGCSLMATPAMAQGLATQVPSLKWIPANAGTYSAMLRNKEQIDIIRNSKAAAKLMSLPFVQLGKLKFDQEWNSPFGPFAEFRKWYDIPANAELVQMFGDLVSDEIFLYADHNCAEFFGLFQEIYYTGQMAPLGKLVKDGPFGFNNDPFYQYRVMLQGLSDNSHRLRFPDFVVGFKLTQTKPAKLSKLIDDSLKVFAKMAPPQVQGRLGKTTIHGSDVHTLTLDGSLVPWDQIPVNKLEERRGQFDKLLKRLKSLKLTLALSVRDDYLLFSFGEGTAGLQALGGSNKLLMNQKEFAPVVKFGDKRLTSISYVSKDYLSHGSEMNIDESMKWMDSMLADSPLDNVQKAKVRKDFRGFLEDVKKYTPEVGAHLEFSFLTNRGLESYSYDWTKYKDIDSSKPLTVLNHVGGQPIGFYVGRSPSQLGVYEDLVKYVKLAHAYFEEFALPEMTPREKNEYETVMKKVLPFLGRFDKATSKMLLPSLDGQGGWILDGKLKIKVPDIAKAMPVPELAVIAGLNDPELFIKAMTEYRESFNGIVDVLTKLAPPGADVPDFKIRLPQVETETKKVGKKTKTTTFYMWPLPKAPELDPIIMPTAALSATEKVVVFAASREHAARLVKSTPFKMDGGPLGDIKKPLAAAAHLNWAALVDDATPWVDEALAQSRAPKDVADQVHTVLDILKCFRSVSTAVYLEQAALVTHTEAIFKDLEK